MKLSRLIIAISFAQIIFCGVCEDLLKAAISAIAVLENPEDRLHEFKSLFEKQSDPTCLALCTMNHEQIIDCPEILKFLSEHMPDSYFKKLARFLVKTHALYTQQQKRGIIIGQGLAPRAGRLLEIITENGLIEAWQAWTQETFQIINTLVAEAFAEELFLGPNSDDIFFVLNQNLQPSAFLLKIKRGLMPELEKDELNEPLFSNVRLTDSLTLIGMLHQEQCQNAIYIKAALKAGFDLLEKHKANPTQITFNQIQDGIRQIESISKRYDSAHELHKKQLAAIPSTNDTFRKIYEAYQAEHKNTSTSCQEYIIQAKEMDYSLSFLEHISEDAKLVLYIIRNNPRAVREVAVYVVSILICVTCFVHARKQYLAQSFTEATEEFALDL